ncbi:inactive protein RESTRICTED TEV MOVEMENT 2-like [Neltuma alba]|uniref:inactive protein RESTRICTED TEV MOVEMENT 2-like n=1 Tax=Neltuma alba TaxID=207710 RepID=UPI0010A3502F|nr:inactive protein RESTRICTED TEV MOVEMENT 2-like [Prosopis alba]
MAMSMRPRRPAFRTQPSNLRPVYQDFKPKSDLTENPEAHVLRIQLPGFTKERIRVQYDESSKLLRVSGERPIDGGIRRSRFREAYQVPQNCIMNKVQSNFGQGILSIIMPKKIISQAEVKPTQEQALAGPSQKADQAIPPKSASTGPGDMEAQKSEEKILSIDSQKPEKELTMAVAEKKADGVPQKIKEETEPKPKSEMVPRKPLDEKPERGQEGTDQNATLTSVNGKPSGEKTGERRGEDAEKERISEKEIIKEGKPSELRKTGNGVKEKSMVIQKENTERRELVKTGEHSVPKIPEKEKEVTSKAEVDTIGKGIKEVATSASQAFARIAQGKWDKEDKPLLWNMGASVLVLAAVGAYALYKFSS